MSQATFSHQFAQRWLKQPEKVKHAIVQELDDIVTLLDEKTDIDTFEFTIDDLSGYIKKTYEEDRLNKIRAHAEAQALALKNARTVLVSTDDTDEDVAIDDDAQSTSFEQHDEQGEDNLGIEETENVEKTKDIEEVVNDVIIENENIAINDSKDSDSTLIDDEDKITSNNGDSVVNNDVVIDKVIAGTVNNDEVDNKTAETDEKQIEDSSNGPEETDAGKKEPNTEAEQLAAEANPEALTENKAKSDVDEDVLEDKPGAEATKEASTKEDDTANVDTSNLDSETADNLDDNSVNKEVPALDEEISNSDDEPSESTQAETDGIHLADGDDIDSSAQILLNEEDIAELEARIDDYISEEMIKISVNIKSWLHDQIKQIQKN